MPSNELRFLTGVNSFHQDLTDLNKFLTANSIPKHLRYELREYMHQTIYLRRAATGNRLLRDLAPKLRNEVALQINEKWLHKIDLISEECEDVCSSPLAPPPRPTPLPHLVHVLTAHLLGRASCSSSPSR